MDKNLKHKIRKLWCNRCLVSISSIIVLGFSVLLLQDALQHYPQQQSWFLRFIQSIETAGYGRRKTSFKSVKDVQYEAGDQERARSRILNIARSNDLYAVSFWILSGNFDLDLEVKKGVNRALARTRELERFLEHDRELTYHDLHRSIYLAREFEGYLQQLKELDQKRIYTQQQYLKQYLGSASWSLKKDLQLDTDKTREWLRDLKQTWELEQIQRQERDQAFVLALELALELEQIYYLKQEQDLDLIRERVQELRQSLERIQEQSDFQSTLFERIVAVDLDRKHGLALQAKADWESFLNTEFSRVRMFLQSGTLLTLLLVILGTLLFILSRMQGLQSLPYSANLVAFLPEEYIAELGILQRRMKKAEASPLQMRLRLLEAFLTLLWVFYIKTKLDDLMIMFQDSQNR